MSGSCAGKRFTSAARHRVILDHSTRGMPLRPPSLARVKHKSTLTPDSLPPPKKKAKAEKGVSILSVRHHMYQLRGFDLT